MAELLGTTPKRSLSLSCEEQCKLKWPECVFGHVVSCLPFLGLETEIKCHAFMSVSQNGMTRLHGVGIGDYVICVSIIVIT